MDPTFVPSLYCPQFLSLRQGVSSFPALCPPIPTDTGVAGFWYPEWQAGTPSLQILASWSLKNTFSDWKMLSKSVEVYWMHIQPPFTLGRDPKWGNLLSLSNRSSIVQWVPVCRFINAHSFFVSSSHIQIGPSLSSVPCVFPSWPLAPVPCMGSVSISKSIRYPLSLSPYYVTVL